MKYISALILYLVYIPACNPSNDLEVIRARKTECQDFQLDYDKVNPKKNTPRIEQFINGCKELGAWHEPTKTL